MRSRWRAWLASKWRVHSRLIFPVAAGIAGLMLTVAIALIAQGAWRDGSIPRLTIAMAIVGFVGTTLSIVNAILNIRASKFPFRRPRAALLEPRLTQSDPFVDRGRETEMLVRAIENHPVTNLHGRKGSGKSHFLAFVSDVTNGYRQSGADRSALRRLADYQVLYFDLSDALGFEDIVKRLFLANFPDQAASWEQLTHIVEISFRRRPVVLILDNVNSEGISASLGRAIYYYLTRRPSDRVVLGSIRPINFVNLEVHRLSFEGFDTSAITELASTSKIQIDREKLAAIHESSDGLPIFLRLLFTHWEHGTVVPPGATAGIRVLLREAILPQLSDYSRQLLVGIALLSVLNPEILGDDLWRLPIAWSDEAIEELHAYSVVNFRRRAGVLRVKLHDLLRDAVLEVCDAAVGPMAHDLAVAASKRGANRESALLWLFAAPNGLDTEVIRERVISTVLTAAEAKDYPFLTSVALIAATRAQVKKLSLADSRLADSLAYAEASAFAGVGKYDEALTALEALGPATSRKLVDAGDDLTALDFELAYLQANLLHLQNRYDEALVAFGALSAITNRSEFEAHTARVEWAMGHVLRHQARDLDAAMRHLNSAEAMAIAAGDLPTRLSSVTNRLGIQIYLDEIPRDAADMLLALQALLDADPPHHNYLPKIWKSLAQVRFRGGESDLAIELIDRAIGKALELNDRLLFNYRFERAEFHRLSQAFGDALDDYSYVLECGRANGDRNLIANALLGIVETEISSGHLIYHRSKADMRGSALQARAIAADADILATQRQAEQTLSRLEGRHEREGRLILF